MISAMMLLEQRKRIVQNGRSSADCTWLNIVGVYWFTTHYCTWLHMHMVGVYGFTVRVQCAAHGCTTACGPTDTGQPFYMEFKVQ